MKEITLIEETENYSLHAKSGLTSAPDPDIGWWVGWVNREGNIYPFALNIDVIKEQEGPIRQELARAAVTIVRTSLIL